MIPQILASYQGKALISSHFGQIFSHPVIEASGYGGGQILKNEFLCCDNRFDCYRGSSVVVVVAAAEAAAAAAAAKGGGKEQ